LDFPGHPWQPTFIATKWLASILRYDMQCIDFCNNDENAFHDSMLGPSSKTYVVNIYVVIIVIVVVVLGKEHASHSMNMCKYEVIVSYCILIYVQV
jgi:hypothetical protein